MKLGLKMNRLTLWVCALAILFAGSLRAQEITGNWQGTITPPQSRPLRVVLQVLHGDSVHNDSGHDDCGALKARIYSIDQGPTGDWVDAISVHDATVKFVVGMLHLSYEGKLSPDGNSITGTLTQGSPLPLNFQKASEATAWPMPH